MPLSPTHTIIPQGGSVSGDWKNNIQFECSDRANQPDLNAIDAGIDDFNAAEPEIHKVVQLSVLARDNSGKIIGGAVGRTWGQCSELQQLWISADARGQGMGTRLMELFETKARQRGSSLVYLDTFSFQARPFYEKCGYHVALETHGFTNGIVKYTMHKRLA